MRDMGLLVCMMKELGRKNLIAINLGVMWDEVGFGFFL